MSGIVGSLLNARGSGVVAKLGTDGQIFTSTGVGLKQGFETITAGGISHADYWRVNAHFDGDANPITANWERNDTAGFGLGDMTQAVSESSGIFTFATTGVYFIECGSSVGNETEDTRHANMFIKTTTDNGSNWYDRCEARCTTENSAGNHTLDSMQASCVFDVTDVSQCKVSIRTYKINTNMRTLGYTDYNSCWVEFIRMAGT
jgi:hypothetical protein